MSNHPQIKNAGNLKDLRRNLRAKLTPAEANLWQIIKNKNICGLRFRRQYSIENYIVDFCCPSGKLIIELDGESHNNSVRSDGDYPRDQRLNELHYKILRFENKVTFKNPDSIIESIKKAAEETPPMN
jgi:very-short-patch-repair endonuclease